MKKIFGICILLFTISVQTSAYSQGNIFLYTEGKYFSIYTSPRVDIADFLKRLNFNYLIHAQNLLFHQDLKTLTANTIDALYLEVSDILDIHVYSYHGTLKILPSRQAIGEIFQRLSGKAFPERSFYLHSRNTIYISAQDATLGMLGHEISHAIISHYFVIPPPQKTQEILCGYVEYKLRKKTHTLY